MRSDGTLHPLKLLAYRQNVPSGTGPEFIVPLGTFRG